MRERLIVFTRYPEPGKTKTRLIPALGPDGAARLQREMTKRTLRVAAEVARRRTVAVEIHYAGGDERRMREWLGSGIPLRPQGEGDLGARMAEAFRDTFEDGAERVVIIGTDCPELTPDCLRRALDGLAERDLVLGPATDGGYYLIGLRRLVPELFVDVAWGTSEVRGETLRIARSLGLTTALLEPLTDVDRPEDLPVWERAKGRRAEAADPNRISIIIPALNEAQNIAAALESTREGENVEVIVVDGGSTDGTREAAQSCGATVLTAARGRGSQMNAGAAEATGGILLFLHADTRLPKGFDSLVRRVLAPPGVVAGAFRLRIDGASRRFRLIERAANFRARRLQMPWGDQGLFLEAARFRELGGFPDMPIMEDFELVRRLRRRGRIALAPAAVLTSARRWRQVGVLRAWLRNRLVVWAYYLGVSPARLARWYRRGRG